MWVPTSGNPSIESPRRLRDSSAAPAPTLVPPSPATPSTPAPLRIPPTVQHDLQDVLSSNSETSAEEDYYDDSDWHEQQFDPVGETVDILSRLNTVAKREILQTVNFMEYRKYERKFRGQYRELSRTRVVIVFLLLTFLVGIFNIRLCHGELLFGVKLPHLTSGIVQWVVSSLGLLVILLVLARTQTSMSLRWSLYVSYLFLLLVVIGFIHKMATRTLTCDADASNGLPIYVRNRPANISLPTHKFPTLKHPPAKRAMQAFRPTLSKLDIAEADDSIAVVNGQAMGGGSSFLQLQQVGSSFLKLKEAGSSEVESSNKVVRGRFRRITSLPQHILRNLVLRNLVTENDDSLMVSSSVLLYAYLSLQLAVLLATFFSIYVYPRCVGKGITFGFRPWKVATYQVRSIQVPLLASDKVPSQSSSPHVERIGRDQYNIHSTGYFVHIRYRALLGRLWNLLCCIPCLGAGSSHKKRWKSHLYQHSCYYLGEVDNLGRAHGFGRWVEETFHGESLVGYWKNGRPIGPFRSKEFGSGSGFSCARIGFARMMDDKTGLLHWGVADVECSISGAFFRGYPRVHKENISPKIKFKNKYRTGHARSGVGKSGAGRSGAGKAGVPTAQGSGKMSSQSDSPLNLRKSVFWDRHIGTYALATLEELKRLGHNPNFSVGPRNEVTIGIDAYGEMTVSEHVRLPTSQNEDSSVTVRLLKPSGLHKPIPIEEPKSSDEYLEARVPILATTAVPYIQVEKWRPIIETEVTEVAVFIHGYNCRLDYALGNFGQLISMSHLPSHIRPIVFSWPGGQSFLSFPCSRRRAMKADISDVFTKFLVGLANANVRRLHVIAHSMGARILLSGLMKAFDACLFAPLLSDHSVDHLTATSLPRGPLELLSCTLLNPEYELDVFVGEIFGSMRRHCSLISIYADANDQALWWGEKYIRKRALGRSVFGLRRNVDFSLLTPQVFFQKLVHPEEEHRPDLSEMPQSTPSPSPLLGLAQLTSQGASITSDCSRRETIMVSPALHTPLASPLDEGFASAQAEWLDLDVIDTTFVQNNAHSIRHNFYNVNREIIDDIADILIHHSRARHRSGRLEHREGNVWVLKVAPSYLGSLYN